MSDANQGLSMRTGAEPVPGDEKLNGPFLALAQLIEDIAFVCDPAGNILWGNAAFEEQTGRSVGDAAFSSIDSCLIHPEDLASVHAQLEDLIRSTNEVSAPIHNRFIDVSGRSRSLRSIVRKVCWRGNPALLFLSRFDLPSPQRAAFEEKGFKSILDSVDDGIFKASADGRLLFANQRLQVIAERSPLELERMTLRQLVDEPVSSQLQSMLSQPVASESARAVRARLITSGRWVEVRGRSIRDPDNNLVLVGLVRDINDAVLAEQREVFYREVFDASSDALFIHDETGRVLDVNLGALRMFHCDREALINSRGNECGWGRPPYSFNDAMDRLRFAIERGPQKFDWRARRQDGELFWAEVTLWATSIAGSVRVIASIHDIDERKRAERELEDNERRLSFAISATADAIWERNLQTREVYYSPRWYTMLGYQDRQFPMTEATFTALCHPDDLQVTLESMEAVAMSPHSNGYEAEYRMRAADGSWYWILGRGNVVERDASGRAVKISGTNTNVTERKRAEEVLAEKEHRFRLMIQNINDMLLILTPDGTVNFVSPACTLMLGYAAHELVGKKAYEFIDPDDVQRVRRAVQGLLESDNRAVVLEFRQAHRDGSVRWVEASVTNLVDDPTIGGLVLAVRDISRRRQSEQEILEWKQRYDLLGLAAGTVVYDRHPGGSVVWGGGFEKMLGFAPGEMQGGLKQWTDRVHPDDIRRVRDDFEHAEERGVSLTVEYRLRRRSGDYVLVEDTSYPYFDEHGKVERFIGVLVDITTRKQADEENARLAASLRQAQKMESIGRLAGGVAHDFNNLLTVISGNVSFAMMDLQRQDPLYESMSEISRAVDSAATLTRQLLAFSRKQVIDPRVLNLNTLVERLQKMLIRLLGEDIELRAVLSESLGQVHVDPGQVEQVIVNLAVNARDAMPDGGRLTLETANVTLDETFCRARGLAQPGEFVMLAVSDNGCGMNEETKSHLFEPFFTTKEQGKGTGLGLATVYGVVTQNRGVIDVYSESGSGTSFKIYLPRTDAEPEVLQTSQLTRLPRGRETIILVEDEDMVREVAVRLLKRQGYRVLAYANGGEAMMALAELHEVLHLLITDVVMPGINGRVLAKNFQALRPAMKVLFTSGYTGDVIVHHGMLEQGIEFISKPYTLEQLAKRVREVLDSAAPGHIQG